VTEAPEERRIKVFNNGTFKGLNPKTPCGGHLCPRSKVGETLL